MLTSRFYTLFLLMLILGACQTAPEVTDPTFPAATATSLPTATITPTPAVVPTQPPAEPVVAMPEKFLTPVYQVGGQIRAVVAAGDEVYFTQGPRLMKLNRLNPAELVQSEILPVLPQKLYLLDNLVYAQMSDQTLWAFAVGEQWQMVGRLALPAGVREIVPAEGELHIYSQPDDTSSQLDSYNSQLQFLRSLSLPPYTAVEDYPRLYQVTAQEISQANAQESSVTFTPLTGFDFSVFEGWREDSGQLLENWTFANGRVYFRNGVDTPHIFTRYEVVEKQLLPQATIEWGSDYLFFSRLEIVNAQVVVVSNHCEGSRCQGGVTLYDLEVPTQPFKDEMILGWEILDTAVSGSTLYVATGDSLQWVELSAGEITPQLLHSAPSQTSSLLLWNNELWVQGSPTQLYHYDLTRPGELQPAAVASAHYHQWFVVRDQLYGQDGLGQFYSLEAAESGEFVSNPLPHWPESMGWPKNWLAQENTAAGLDNSGLHFVEIVSPLEVRSAGQYPGPFESFIWQENLIAAQKLTSTGSQITLLDVTDRTNIQLLSVTEDLGRPLAFLGDYLYLYNAGFLNVVDIRQPQKPEVWHQVVLPAPLYGLKIEGAIGYGWGNDLWVFDVSDPARPRLTATTPTAGVVSDVLVVGAYLYVADSAEGVLVFER